MELGNLSKIYRSRNPKKRIGRGGGSGKGFHTVGRGHKGQKARGGNNIPAGFEGGQVPLYKKLPKLKGFGRVSIKPIVLNVQRLNKLPENTEVSISSLIKAGLVSKDAQKLGVKILGTGRLSKKLTFSADVVYSNSVASLIGKGKKVKD